MHEKAKQRIAEAKKVVDDRPLVELPDSDNLYLTLKGAIGRLCDEALKSGKLSDEECAAVACIRSRIQIEM